MGESLGSTKRFLPDVAATDELAASLAASLPDDSPGFVLLLAGDLGSGKSSLARGMLHALGVSGPVPSPTYTLVEPYNVDGRAFFHVDLYRIASPEELDFLGWSDMRDGTMMIEWPERVPELLGSADALLTMRYSGEGREASLEVMSPRAKPLLDAMAGGAD